MSLSPGGVGMPSGLSAAAPDGGGTLRSPQQVQPLAGGGFPGIMDATLQHAGALIPISVNQFSHQNDVLILAFF